MVPIRKEVGSAPTAKLDTVTKRKIPAPVIQFVTSTSVTELSELIIYLIKLYDFLAIYFSFLYLLRQVYLK
jgi:hypothetical protein